jgi:hypothetical protein
MQFENLERLIIRSAPLMNGPVAALANSPRFGWLVRRNIAMVTYTGRKSGRTFSIPVAYRRSGDDMIIGVSMPDTKTWWRNFLGDGAPLTLRIGGTDHPAHAVAKRDDQGGVAVTARLNG